MRPDPNSRSSEAAGGARAGSVERCHARANEALGRKENVLHALAAAEDPVEEQIGALGQIGVDGRVVVGDAHLAELGELVEAQELAVELAHHCFRSCLPISFSARAPAPSAVSYLPAAAGRVQERVVGCGIPQPEGQLGRHFIARERRARRAELGAVQKVWRLQHRFQDEAGALGKGAQRSRSGRSRVEELR